MSETCDHDELLETTARVLIRCFMMGLIILLFWGLLILLAGDLVCNVHSTVFPMTSQQFYAIHYAGLAFTKICVFLLFFLPYVSIRLVQRKKSAGHSS